MRADFYPRCLTYPDLAARLESGQVAVTPMTEGELRQAIELPAQKVRLTFERGLVDAILDDVLGEPGALPLLQYALLELWQRREGRRLTFQAYRDIGGVEGAIARRAEEIYTGFTSQEQGLVRRVMMRLVQPGIGTEDTRRRATLAELSPLPESGEGPGVRAVIQALADARLVTTGRDPASGQVTVEVAHEALIRGWPRLRGWLDEDWQFLLWRQRSRAALGEWERLRHDEGALLRGGALAEAERWLAERGGDLSLDERAYIQASIVQREREQQLDEDREFLKWRLQLRDNIAAWKLTRHNWFRLLRGKSVGEAEHWLAQRAEALNREERDYILASVAMQERLRRGKWRWIGLGLTAVVLSTILVLAWLGANLCILGPLAFLLVGCLIQVWYTLQAEAEARGQESK